MKVFAILIVLAGTALCTQAALPNVGICSFDSYHNKIRTCLAYFIKGLQKNPNDNCKVYVESFINCSAVAGKSCIPLPGVTIESMRKALKAEFTEEFMCKRSSLQYPNPSSVNVTLPCSITSAEYVTKMNGCAEKMSKKWSANRADPTMCSEYRDAKECMKKVVDKYCQFKGVLLELMKYQFDDFNPFCANNKDPTSKVSTIVVSKAVIAISLVAVAAIQAF